MYVSVCVNVHVCVCMCERVHERRVHLSSSLMLYNSF